VSRRNDSPVLGELEHIFQVSKVLVTGGQGFLGSHLVRRLVDSGKNVLVMSHQDGENGVGEIVTGDIRDPDFVRSAVEGVDVVVHLVSNFRQAGTDRRDAYAVNVGGTRNVVSACVRCGVQRLVHCSTIGVHGSVKEIPANEDTPFNPGDQYQETKLAAEMYVWDNYHRTGLPTTVIRPISMYGPGDTRMLKLFKAIKKGIFFMVGDGNALFQPAYIDDVVEGFMLSIEMPQAVGEAFILGNREYLPLNELVEVIAAELHVKSHRFHLPLKPMLVLAKIIESTFIPLGWEPPLHTRRMSFFCNNRAFSIEKAVRLLGYEPKVSLQEGVRRTIRWYEAQGWL
jgi:nucleoside-diphosphate-sugar epimerase